MEIENRKKIFGKKAVVAIGVIAIALMLTVGIVAVEYKNAAVTTKQLEPEETCQVCEYLKTLYDGADDPFTYNMTREQYVAKYGMEGTFYAEAVADMASCPAGSNPIDAIIAEYNATGSLDTFFAPLLSYLSSSSSEGIVEVQSSPISKHSGTTSFDLQKVVIGDTIVKRPITEEDISAVDPTISYTAAELRASYPQFYQRALVIKEWLEEDGPAPTWMTETDWEKTQAELDCLMLTMFGASAVKCFVAPFIVASPILFGLPFTFIIVRFFAFRPDLLQMAGPIFQTCVAIDSLFRAVAGLPP